MPRDHYLIENRVFFLLKKIPYLNGGCFVKLIKFSGKKPIETHEGKVTEANRVISGKKYQVKTRSIQGQAIDIAFAAYDESSSKKRMAMAERALRIDENCAEAYLLISEEFEGNPVMQAIYQELALIGATKNLGEKFFKNNAGHFWGLSETRTFMHAKYGLAVSLWKMRRQSEAIEHFWEMLELNPNDNQGVRFNLFDFLLIDNQIKQISDLLKLYPEEDMAHWYYNLALYYFKTQGMESKKAHEFVNMAVKQNAIVLEYLVAEKEIPDETPEMYTMGSREEAILCVTDSVIAWFNTPGSLEWLEMLTKNTNVKTFIKASKKNKSPAPRKKSRELQSDR
jgi:tetratricopeptide (TPR) repeat protein